MRMNYVGSVLLLQLFYVPCALGQSLEDSLIHRLRSCLFSSGTCDLYWNLDVPDSACPTFSLKHYDGTAITSGALVLPPSVLSFKEADYIDTVQALLFSYQLSRYGETSLCSDEGVGNVHRLIVIDEQGLRSIRANCKNRRCSLRVLTDTSNAWLFKDRVEPHEKFIDVPEKRIAKVFGKLDRVITSRANAHPFGGHFLIAEERLGTTLLRSGYYYTTQNKRTFTKAMRRLTR